MGDTARGTNAINLLWRVGRGGVTFKSYCRDNPLRYFTRDIPEFTLCNRAPSVSMYSATCAPAVYLSAVRGILRGTAKWKLPETDERRISL